MKILSKAQASKLKLLPRHGNKGNPNPVTIPLNADTFKVGCNMFVKKEEYNLKTNFGTFIQQSFRVSRSNKKFSIRRLANDSGWLVTRIK